VCNNEKAIGVTRVQNRISISVTRPEALRIFVDPAFDELHTFVLGRGQEVVPGPAIDQIPAGALRFSAVEFRNDDEALISRRDEMDL
jgi:hypothetical protein